MYTFVMKADELGIGLLPDELDLLNDRLRLVERQDGSDRGMRPSAWLRFELYR